MKITFIRHAESTFNKLEQTLNNLKDYVGENR